MILRISRLAVVSLIIASLGLLSVLNDKVMAGVPDWNAGYIISDQVFTDTSRMSVSQIQTFLNSKVPNCDTYGQALSEFGGPDTNGDGKVQRWEWGQANYSQTVFPCLKDVRVADGRSAAQVIYDVSQQYGINPQVFMVLLQKEQGLVTDTWPLNRQYRAATGYGCPDTAACDSQYYWLDNQIEWSGKMYRAIMDNSPSWYTPYELGNNFIKYNPNSSCGGSNVYVQNRATQALYNYTPYQPNQATLDAGWGPAYCGAYGNLRFFQYFTSWFGPTRGGDATSYDLQLTSNITVSPANPRIGETTTASYSIKNISNSTVTWEMDTLQCRNSAINCDPTPGGPREIAPGETIVRSFSITPTSQGNLTLVPFYRSNGMWWRMALNINNSNSLTTWVAGLSTSAGLTTSPTAPNIGETMKHTITINNPTNTPLSIDGTLLQCRYEISTMCDSPMTSPETIPAGGSKTYTYTITASQSGNYSLIPYYRYKGIWFRYIGGDTPKQLHASNIILDVHPQITPSNPIPGEPVTVSYTIRNAGPTRVDINRGVTQCRRSTNIICDPTAWPSISLNQNETVVISDSFTAAQGTYRFVPYFDIQGEWHTFQGINPTALNVEKYRADLRVVNPVITNNPIPGEPLTASYSIKNFGTKTAYYQMGLLQCRYNTYTMCDSPNYGTISIEPGATRDFNDTLSAHAKSGRYTLRPLYRQDDSWYDYKTPDGSNIYNPTIKNIDTYSPDLKVIDFRTSLPNPLLGQTGTVEYTIRNDDSRTIYGDMSITQCRINLYTLCDPAAGPTYTLAPGSTKTVTETFSFSGIGEYRFIPYLRYDGRWIRPLDLSTHLSMMYLMVR